MNPSRRKVTTVDAGSAYRSENLAEDLLANLHPFSIRFVDDTILTGCRLLAWGTDGYVLVTANGGDSKYLVPRSAIKYITVHFPSRRDSLPSQVEGMLQVMSGLVGTGTSH